MMIKDKFKKDIIITALSQIVIMGVLLIMNKVLSIRLGPDNYTIYSIMNKTSSLVAFFIIFALGIAIPRYVPLYIGANKEKHAGNFVKYALWLMLLLILLVGLVILLFGGKLSVLIFDNVNSIDYIYGIYCYAVGIGCITFLYSYYRGLNNFFSYNVVQIINQLYLLVIVFLSGTNLFHMFILWGIVMSLVSLCILIYRIQKDFKLSFFSIKTDVLKKSMMEILSFCLPRVPGELVLFSFVSVPLIILNNKLGSNNTAGFVVALMLTSMVTPIFGLVGTVLLPYVSQNIGKQKGFNNLRNRINGLLKIYVVVSIVMTVVIGLLGKEFLWILFSKEYTKYAYILGWISLSILPNSIYLLLRNPLDAISKIPYNTINLCIAFIVLIGMLVFCNNEISYITAFIISYWILGILSCIAWYFLNKQMKEDV